MKKKISNNFFCWLIQKIHSIDIDEFLLYRKQKKAVVVCHQENESLLDLWIFGFECRKRWKISHVLTSEFFDDSIKNFDSVLLTGKDSDTTSIWNGWRLNLVNYFSGRFWQKVNKVFFPKIYFHCWICFSFIWTCEFSTPSFHPNSLLKHESGGKILVEKEWLRTTCTLIIESWECWEDGKRLFSRN